ncbi:hypothetical protein Tco_0140715 [Tanacetum coccineum]
MPCSSFSSMDQRHLRIIVKSVRKGQSQSDNAKKSIKGHPACSTQPEIPIGNGFGRQCKALGTCLDMSTAYHPQTDGQSEHTIQTLEDMLRAARDRQKSYADKRRKPLEFSVGDYVLLKVSSCKGVVRFGKKGKLAPRFVRPFEIIEKVGPVAYRLDLPEELNGVHDTFHVSNLKKYLADPKLQVPLDEIRVDAKLNFVEEPVEILEREFKKLKGLPSSRFGGIRNVALNSRVNFPPLSGCDRLKDTSNSLNPIKESLVPEGDNVNFSSYARRTKTNVTSFGESTNPSWSKMNPGSVTNEQNIWSSSFPTGSFTSSFDDSIVVPVPTRWTSYDQPSTMKPTSETPIVKSVDINAEPTSYVGATGASTKDQTKAEANFHSFLADKVFDGVNISISCNVVEKVSVRFKNTLYGYFIGKRMAFPVVEYYVKNNWAKHGLKRIMMNAKGLFSSNLILGLEDVISLIATHLRKPIMLDSYTSVMCKDSWGRSSFARCLIKINSEADLKDSITFGIPDLEGLGFTKETIRVVTTPVVIDSNDGLQQVVNKKHNNKRNSTSNMLPKGVPVVKGFQVGKDFAFQPKAPKAGSNGGGTRSEVSSKVGSSKNTKEGASLTEQGTFTARKKDKDVVDTGQMKMSNITTPNPFTVLGEDDEEEVENVRWKWTSNESLCPKDNYYMDRRALWSNLVGHASLMRNRPWVLMGDFNAALNLEDHSSGGYEPNVAIRGFKECVQDMEVSDVNCTGLHFTWNQKPKGSKGILKKIDMIMGNLQFNDDFLGSFAIFQPCRISDHSPCVLHIPTVTKSKSKPFKFTNFLVYKEGFCEVVESGWNVNFEGFAMYQVVKRLKGLKSPFSIDKDPSSSILREEHAHYLLTFKEAQLDEEQFLKQKAKVEWFKAGDSKTAYFYRIVKSKCARNRIDMVNDSSNTLYDGNQVLGAFVNHYGQFLGTEGATNHLDDHDLYTHVLDTTKADFMVRDVTDIEFKNVIFSMGDDKAKGPDGFTVAFFKKAWDVVIGDITSVIRDFFLQCKLIANRIKEGLGNIVGINQSTFIPGRRISNSILLTQELIRNYHRRRGPPRCAFKVDIQKAYDTVDWKFLETILVGFGFHPKMVQWIMVCVSGASYSICVNGNLHGWFKGKRGLRQGDPLSPYLFTLVMEVLTLTLKSMVRNSNEFHYHHHCEKQRIINLCFADDLFLFAHGHPNSVSVIIDALEEFKQVSGLVPSILKSTTFFCNVPNAIKASIMNSMPFAEGEMKKGKAKVVWDSVCMPKHEGGLDVCSLKDMLSNRDIARSGFSLDDLVSNLISDGAWRWPPDWLSRDDDLQSFSMACVWDTIRSWEDMVQWYNVVWFPHCILHHAIHMWLVVQQKLKTQDRLQQWDVGPSIDLNLLRCPLCELVPDSHDHLFFECPFLYRCGLRRNGRLSRRRLRLRIKLFRRRLFSGSNCSSYSNGAVEAGHFQV